MRPKMFTNVPENSGWMDKDELWILPALGDEGGPIQIYDKTVVEDKDFQVFTVTDENVELSNKIIHQKQLWTKESPNSDGDFRLNFRIEEEGVTVHLTAVTSEILTGTVKRKINTSLCIS